MIDNWDWLLKANQTNFEKVVEFHAVFGAHIEPTPKLPSQEIIDLRERLIDEEYLKEYKDAVAANDIVAIADALTDILYVVYGTGVSYGINLDETFDEVHRSNMSKLGPDGKPIHREDGKVMKGPNYTPPDLEAVLRRQGM